ncbi:MAG: hypothetical protein OXG44_18485 [Gammaproteobacteria bacterium]|nr:hypothetical protein [Gammaproteobacteria bacterium]MDE0191858.1 hypothetical protein [Gammaproteobacteria bacterium]
MNDFLAPWKFRFRGKTGRLLSIVDCFRKEPNKGLAVVQVARASALPIHDAAKLLESTPELFIKLPGRGDGITRYRLASSVAARSDKAIGDLVQRHARRESGIFYALMLMGLLVLVVIAMIIVPSLL